jgi:protein associated with RNAse G/E
MTLPAESFRPGEHIVRRDVWFGRTWTLGPARVIEDDGRTLVTALWPGVEVLAPATWVAWLEGADDSVRAQALPRLRDGDWELRRWVWRDNVYLNIRGDGQWFDATAVFRCSDHEFLGWKVDFGRPYVRVAGGIETRDLFIDLMVTPDLVCEWKDEEEYEQARRWGLVSPSEHEHLLDAKNEVAALLAKREGPFDPRWPQWRVDPGWPIPAIPEVAR